MLIAASVALLGLAAAAYWRQLVHGGGRWLFGLRLATVVLFLAILTSRVFHFNWTERQRRVVVLQDASASLGAVGADTVAERLAAVIPMPDGARREAWRFADSAVRAGGSSRFDPGQTRLAAALRAAARTRPAAIVVVSDGQDNGSEDPVAAAFSAGVPVHTVGVGSAGRCNLAVVSAEAEGEVHVGETASVVVRVAWSGLGYGNARLVLDGQTRAVALGPSPAEQEVVFRRVFQRAGRAQLRVWAESIPGEATHADNSRTAAVDVRPARVRVVYIAGRPGFGSRVIPAVLAEDPRLEVARQGGIRQGVGRPGQERADAYILDGAAEDHMSAGVLAAVEQQVLGGAGLLVLAGPGFSAGPVLMRVLPVPVAGGTDSGVFTPVAVGEGRYLPWFSVGTGVDLNSVPPFQGAVRLAAATNRVATWLQVQETGAPLMVAGRYGKGRVVFLAGYPVWRWGFEQQAPAGRSGLGLMLSSLARYLANPDTESFRLETDKAAYLAGEVAETRLRARHGDGTAWSGLDVFVSTGDGREPMIERGQGTYAARVRVAPGTEMLTAHARSADSEVGTARAQVIVSSQGVEVSSLGLDRYLLERIAEATGGRYFPADSLPHDRSTLATGTHRRSVALDPRRSLAAFAVVVLLAGSELVLRRRKGLM